QVTLVAPSRRRPRAGDVVLAATASGLRLHRLMWAPRGGRWRTKADRSPTWDPAVRGTDVLATVVEVGGLGASRPTRSTAQLAVSWARAQGRVDTSGADTLPPRPPRGRVGSISGVGPDVRAHGGRDVDRGGEFVLPRRGHRRGRSHL